MNGMDPFIEQIKEFTMKYNVEYRINGIENNGTFFTQFLDVDDAIDFIGTLRRSFDKNLEWAFIHIL